MSYYKYLLMIKEPGKKRARSATVRAKDNKELEQTCFALLPSGTKVTVKKKTYVHSASRGR